MAKRTARLAPAQAQEAILKGECPPGAVVEGGLAFVSEPGLAELPRDLTVLGPLQVDGCHRLKRLPKGLSATALSVRECASLEGFEPAPGTAFQVDGDLLFSKCPSLARFPEALEVGRDLTLKDCHQAWTNPMGLPLWVPERVRVGRAAVLDGCVGLTELPGRMEVGLELRIIGSPFLAEIRAEEGFGTLTVGTACLIKRCHGLRRVASLSFAGEGELAVIDCDALEAIGDGVRPQGRLALMDCPSLARLPRRLDLKGSLVADNCPSLGAPPAGIRAREGLWPSGTTPRWADAPAAAAPVGRPTRQAP